MSRLPNGGYVRRIWLSLLLAAALLFAQQGGFVHALSHLHGSRAPAEKQLPHSPACEQCVAHAPLGAGLTPQPLLFAPASPVPLAVPAPAQGFSPRFFTATRSRAPPVLA
ncbi:hypothetical protein [Thiobacter aerophilum]|uniref:DUF2946 domain-containing protein n=1 Tax=Thiobacter aerophilum TaxID=3121275 RepID=A0ABV0EFM1_9BURK